MRKKILISFVALLFVSGCSSGLSCKNTMGGTRCATIQTVYEQSVLEAGVTPDPKPEDNKENNKQTQSKPLTEKEQIVSVLAGNNSRPIRIPTVVLRIWTAPWEDQDGDLHQSGYIYCEINEKRGRWLFGESAVGSNYDYNVHRPAVEAPKVDMEAVKTDTTKQQSATRSYGAPPQDNNTLKLSK
jgi:conjugal transfer pilus assembly protein TraV